MKIAINAVRVSRQGGGGTDHYITHLVRELARQGRDFDLFTFVPGQFPDVPADRIKVPFDLTLAGPAIHHQELRAEAEGKNIGSSNGMRRCLALWFGDWIKMIWTQFFFPVTLITERYDLVFSPSQIDALPYPPVKQVTTVLDVIPFVLDLPLVKHGFFLRNFFPAALRNSERILAISENTKKDLTRLFKVPAEKITAIPLAQPDLAGKSGGLASQGDIDSIKKKYGLGHYILCVSGNHAHKNLPRLLQAFKLIADKTDRQLVVAGYQDADQQTKLENWVKQNDLSSRIGFLGHTPSADLPLLYQAADLFVFPSLYEGFGLPPLEALSYGVPVASSNSSSLPEVVGCAGVYFDPEKEQEIADRMLDVLNNPELAQQLRKKGIEQARKFSWESTARATWAAFENVLGK